MSFSDCIEFYESQSLDYVMKKFKKCYEQAKWRPNFKSDQKLKEVGKTSVNGQTKLRIEESINDIDPTSKSYHGNGVLQFPIFSNSSKLKKS